MTQLEQRIYAAQRRLWLNRWMSRLCSGLAIAAGLFATMVLVQRLYDLPLPLMWIGVGLTAGALANGLLMTYVTREDGATAAAALDAAAGLRERISSGRFCLHSDDPFARAVVADAEHVSASITPRQHLPLHVPRSFASACALVVLSAGMFLITPGLLKPQKEVEASQQVEQVKQTKAAVLRKLEEVKKATEASPLLDDLKDELDGLDKQAGGELTRPESIRHEAVKKIDNLADAVKNMRDESKYDALAETRKMMRGLETPRQQDALTQKLNQSLAQGDFKSAKEEVEAIKEQLATLKSEQDKEMVDKLSKQLDDLAKQLEKLSTPEKIAKALEEAGIKKEDMERILESLSKKDIEQLKKQLEEKGLNPQQAEKLAKQLQQKQNATDAGKQLAQSLKQAAKGAQNPQAGDASAGLSQAAQQLSELEQLEQEAAQLESTLEALQDAQAELGNPCSKCNGTGKDGGKTCAKCNGSGNAGDKEGTARGGMGPKGQGRGGKAEEEKTDVAFKTERQKVHSGKGAIVGQFLVDGEQVKGEVNREFVEVVAAAEREASDRIKRDRIPRQYHSAIKAYFSDMQKSLETIKKQDEQTAPDDGGKSNQEAPKND